jgi:hypothetical protein
MNHSIFVNDGESYNGGDLEQSKPYQKMRHDLIEKTVQAKFDWNEKSQKISVCHQRKPQNRLDIQNTKIIPFPG